jgi:hypothetical protein
MRRAWPLLVVAAGLGCGRRAPTEPALNLAAGQVASAASRSPDGSCVAIGVSDAEGHSPLTTSSVAVARRGDARYQELRLPPPDERFSTLVDRWEQPGVLRIRATTLDGDVAARYTCATERMEVIR